MARILQWLQRLQSRRHCNLFLSLQVSVSGTGLDPTISWTNTGWTTPSTFDAVAIRIRDNAITATLNGGNNASVVSLSYFCAHDHQCESFATPSRSIDRRPRILD